MSEEPDFGPRGYLPERAARRARKIVLRAPLGWQWIAASVVTGAVIAVAAAVFLVRAGEPPPDPFVEVGPVEAIGAARHDPALNLLFVAAAGRVRAFEVAAGAPVPMWCGESGRLEAPPDRVWLPTGRALDGGASLEQRPVVVHDGVVYVDPTTVVESPPAVDEDASPACL